MNKPHYLPGDKAHRNDISGLLRVNHAGEYGAVRIYKGQLAANKDISAKPILKHMLEQEEAHLKSFNELLNEHKTRPSLLNPLWHIGGWLMGYATASMGTANAYACTEAVENAIDQHYSEQIIELKDSPHKDLTELLEKFRLEELEHRDTAIENGAQQASGYNFMTNAITRISKLSIWLAKRI